MDKEDRFELVEFRGISLLGYGLGSRWIELSSIFGVSNLEE
jgi:hypothetical protein